MKVIDFMKKNGDKNFFFNLWDGNGNEDGLELFPDLDDSYLFRGYDGFLAFKSAYEEKYRVLYRPMVSAEIDEGVHPYYLNDTCILFNYVCIEDKVYWMSKEDFESNPSLVATIKELVWHSTCTTKKVG